MKVIGVLSSPHGRKSTTLGLVEAALEGAAKAGAETEMIDVTKLKIRYCKGCNSCYRKGRCPQRDDFPQTFDKLLEADGIILSSPNYINNVTGQMKTFMDRMVDAVHAQLFDGKYGFSVVTAGGSGEEAVADIMNSFLTGAGATVIGSVAIASGRNPGDLPAAREKAGALGTELANAIREKRRYPEQELLHEEFRERFGVTLRYNKEKWPSDYRHWVEKGWIRE